MALSKASAAAADMFAIIDRKSKIDSLSTEGSSIPGFKGDIRFRGLHFSYPTRPDTSILHGLDLDVCEGQTTALVGASGSGKSTIFGLLERWYTFNGGTITLDGHQIESLNLQWLRTNIRLVPQVRSPRLSCVKLKTLTSGRNRCFSAAASTKMLSMVLWEPIWLVFPRPRSGSSSSSHAKQHLPTISLKTSPR